MGLFSEADDTTTGLFSEIEDKTNELCSIETEWLLREMADHYAFHNGYTKVFNDGMTEIADEDAFIADIRSNAKLMHLSKSSKLYGFLEKWYNKNNKDMKYNIKYFVDLGNAICFVCTDNKPSEYSLFSGFIRKQKAIEDFKKFVQSQGE